MRKILAIALLFLSSPAGAADFKPNVLDPTYNHDRWGTSANCILANFRAYTSCFDDFDDDNDDGISDVWGVPEWVAYEIKKTDAQCIKTYARPSKWITDPDLFTHGIMPDDKSYAYPKAFTSKRKDGFSRGHLAMKMHAERLGADAGWNTHTFYNAVPQRQRFNAGIWLDLEDLTSAWAQEYGSIWIITGPIFADKSPYASIGQEGEFPVAIPDALFKIVVKESVDPERPDVLAFIYPQVGAGYYEGKPFDHTRYMTSIDEIEKLTGIDFFQSLPDAAKETIKSQEKHPLWPVKNQDFIKACQSGYND
ncbi:MAG: DNA/RNA non-specific endonuclease [Alphaproteobacteria bacterium]